MTRRVLVKKWDILLLCAGLALAAVLPVLIARAGAEGKLTGCVAIDGQVVAYVDLTMDREFAPEALPAVRLAVRGGGFAIVESDCPDKTCVHSGFIHRPGQMAVCLPNRVSLTVQRGMGADEVDFVAD